MEIIHVIRILIAIACIIYAAVKGFSVLIVAPIAGIVVILTNQTDFFSSLIGNEHSFKTARKFCNCK